jgi:hypothetical protein
VWGHRGLAMTALGIGGSWGAQAVTDVRRGRGAKGSPNVKIFLASASECAAGLQIMRCRTYVVP